MLRRNFNLWKKSGLNPSGRAFGQSAWVSTMPVSKLYCICISMSVFLPRSACSTCLDPSRVHCSKLASSVPRITQHRGLRTEASTMFHTTTSKHKILVGAGYGRLHLLLTEGGAKLKTPTTNARLSCAKPGRWEPSGLRTCEERLN